MGKEEKKCCVLIVLKWVKREFTKQAREAV